MDAHTSTRGERLLYAVGPAGVKGVRSWPRWDSPLLRYGSAG